MCIVRFWLPNTRLLRRPKSGEAGLMRFLDYFVRSPENNFFFRVLSCFQVIENVRAARDEALHFVVLTKR